MLVICGSRSLAVKLMRRNKQKKSNSLARKGPMTKLLIRARVRNKSLSPTRMAAEE